RRVIFPEGRSARPPRRRACDQALELLEVTGRADGDDDLVGVDNGLGRWVRRERAILVSQRQDERPGSVPDVCLADAASLDRRGSGHGDLLEAELDAAVV